MERKAGPREGRNGEARRLKDTDCQGQRTGMKE